MHAKAGIRKLQRSGHNTKQSHMKQISQLISNSTKSLPGRWTKVTTMGCILALVFLVAASPQPQTSGKARPFKVTGIISLNQDFTFGVVGTATHLGKIVGQGTIEITEVSADGKIHYKVAAIWTAANGDSINFYGPDWVADNNVIPPTNIGDGVIKGGTGRFANASGSLFGEISSPASILTCEGTISY